MPGLRINNNYKLEADYPLDWKYGPFEFVEDALAEIIEDWRYEGLTVYITSAEANYWWKNDLSDEGLILKDEGGAIGLAVNLSSFKKIQLVVGAGEPNPEDGATTYTNPLFKNREIDVTRGNLPLWEGDPGDGEMYYTKPFDSDTVTFSHPLTQGERIKITFVLTGLVRALGVSEGVSYSNGSFRAKAIGTGSNNNTSTSTASIISA